MKYSIIWLRIISFFKQNILLVLLLPNRLAILWIIRSNRTLMLFSGDLFWLSKISSRVLQKPIEWIEDHLSCSELSGTSVAIFHYCRLNFQRVFANIFKNWSHIRKNRDLYKNSRATLLKNFEEWEKRLEGKPFHGGEKPDEADFDVRVFL